jgi:hypothetical protein
MTMKQAAKTSAVMPAARQILRRITPPTYSSSS